jgi:hypothetical protein
MAINPDENYIYPVTGDSRPPVLNAGTRMGLRPDLEQQAHRARSLAWTINGCRPPALKPVIYFEKSVRRSGCKGRAEVSHFVLREDGELQEGMIREALHIEGRFGLEELERT